MLLPYVADVICHLLIVVILADVIAKADVFTFLWQMEWPLFMWWADVIALWQMV